MNLGRAVWGGIISGLFLGLFFKVVEETAGEKVYTLLLNVDYIPVLNEVPMSESVEFLLHLIVSILLSLGLLLFLSRKKWSPKQEYWFVAAVSILVGLLLFPTTILSDRTPGIDSVPAFLYWLLGHVCYGVILGLFLKQQHR
jgi:FtsH-binding integral membrane protein